MSESSVDIAVAGYPCGQCDPDCSLPVRLFCLSHADLQQREFLTIACREVAQAADCDEVLVLVREGEDALSCRYRPGDEIDLGTLDRAGMEATRIAELQRRPSPAVFPLEVAEQQIGVLGLLRSDEPGYGPGDEPRLLEIARALAAALLSRRCRLDLRERVKELSCLYQLFEIAEQPGSGLDAVLQSVAGSLPSAWQYPEIAHGRVCLDGRVFASDEGSDAVAVQRGDVIIDGQQRGWVEVVYSEPRPNLDEGPFLTEERNLIEAVAHQLAIVVERHQHEGERERLQEQLRHADRLATIGQLSAGMAHELNEPLGNILGFAQLALADEALGDGTRGDLGNIVKASLHAREVIKKLMVFARQSPPSVTEVDLNRVVTESLYFLASRCAKEGIDLVEELASDLPPLQADPAQLNQVLVNLVVNAIQATGAGGRVTVTTRSVGPDLLLEVSDTGHGIPAEQQPRIFLPFFTTKDVDQGTGLGLSVVHGIVATHGGTIDVQSAVGEGTTLRVTVPTHGPGESYP
jgi:signal transduction histidine kinase